MVVMMSTTEMLVTDSDGACGGNDKNDNCSDEDGGNGHNGDRNILGSAENVMGTVMMIVVIVVVVKMVMMFLVMLEVKKMMMMMSGC